MALNEILIPEYKMELATTRNILACVDMKLSDFKPHEKSMSLGRLATHVAEIPGWMDITVNKDELDFASGNFKPFIAASNEALLELFDANAEKAIDILSATSDITFAQNWTMRSGDQIFFTLSKFNVVRTWVMNHLYHHRAQLGVYLRLNNIAVPGTYGPSADATGM